MADLYLQDSAYFVRAEMPQQFCIVITVSAVQDIKSVPSVCVSVCEHSHAGLKNLTCIVKIILCELVSSTWDQLVDHQQKTPTVISGQFCMTLVGEGHPSSNLCVPPLPTGLNCDSISTIWSQNLVQELTSMVSRTSSMFKGKGHKVKTRDFHDFLI